MPTLAIIGIILFVVGYLIPAAIEIYEKTQAKDALDDRVSLFSIRADWFTAFSALAVGMSGFLIYIWTGGTIALSLPDRDLATIVVLAGSASAFLSFVIMKWLEGILMVLGYMWDNTVVARRRRLADKERAEIREKALEEGRTEGRAALEDAHEENARLKARIAELEQNRNADAAHRPQTRQRLAGFVCATQPKLEEQPMPKMVFMPPQDDLRRAFAARLSDTLPEYEVASPETDAEALEQIRDADAAFGWAPPAALAAAEKLRWLHSPDAGPFFGFYYPELMQSPITITNPRGIYFDHISHHIMMFVFALSRGLPWYMDAQRRRDWDKDARKSEYIDLADATALINGVGGIGHETARICHMLGMQVIGLDPRPEYDLPYVEFHSPDEIDALLPRADFVITTVPHTPITEGMFNARRFALMKPTAYFINIGRGMVCKIDDLADAVESGIIAGAGLDVFEQEPLPSDHKLWGLPNVLMTPHIAVKDAHNIDERRFEVLIGNARRFLADEPLNNIVDKSKWY